MDAAIKTIRHRMRYRRTLSRLKEFIGNMHLAEIGYGKSRAIRTATVLAEELAELLDHPADDEPGKAQEPVKPA